MEVTIRNGEDHTTKVVISKTFASRIFGEMSEYVREVEPEIPKPNKRVYVCEESFKIQSYITDMVVMIWEKDVIIVLH